MIVYNSIRRSLLSPSGGKSPQLCHLASLRLPIFIENGKNRGVHNTTSSRQSTTEAVPEIAKESKEIPTSSLGKRFTITGEVIISKIFPAGFGWQSSSILAENYLGYSPDSAAFALTTGMGDAIGVMVGHCGYYAMKKAVTGNDKIILKREFDTGILLASAAFCSGSLWQPLVDALQGANLSFTSVFAGTWVGCGTAFYAGLRIGRTVFPSFLEYVEEPSYENSTTDAALSVAIGGATGFFVGTDAAYLPSQNFLIDIVGIHDGTPDLLGCAIAGSSTGLGFGVAQSFMNVAYPTGKSWND
jgi:hypothetical protein